MQLGPEDLTVTINGARQASSTTMGALGAYVVVIATTLPDQVLELTSCYLAALHGPAAVTQLLLRTGPSHDFKHEILDDELVGTTHPRRCLLHHAGELHRAIATVTSHDVLVDVQPIALEAADTIWADNHGP